MELHLQTWNHSRYSDAASEYSGRTDVARVLFDSICGTQEQVQMSISLSECCQFIAQK